MANDSRSCRGCQCTDEAPCVGGCAWVADRWCTACEEKVDHYVGHIAEQAREHGLPLITVFAHDGTTCTVSSGLLGPMSVIEQARTLIHASYAHLDEASAAEGSHDAYEIGGPR